MTRGADIGAIKIILAHAAAVRGPEIPSEAVDLHRVARKRPGVSGKGVERECCPTTAEPSRVSECLDENAHLILPTRRIVHVATALRLDQICRVAGGAASTSIAACC